MLTTERFDQSAALDYTQAAGGVAGILNGAKLILGTNTIAPGKKSVVADITQSPDGNLAPAVLTWGAAVRDSAGDIVTVSSQRLVQLASSANACVLKSWGLTDAAGTGLLLCGNLPGNGLDLPDTLAAYSLSIPFAPGNPQGKDLQIIA